MLALLWITICISNVLVEFLPISYEGSCMNFAGSAALVEIYSLSECF